MSLSKVKVSLQISEPRLPDRETWYELIYNFEQEIARPSRVKVIITDNFDVTVARCEKKSPLKLNPDAPIAYTAMKPGGAMAGAKTIEQGGNQIAVIFNVNLARLGKELVRRILLHEAQHVRLVQGGDTAIAVHRRAGITQAPEGLDWNFTWMAESLVDEFRCERALYEKGLPNSEMLPAPEEYLEVAHLVKEVQSEYKANQDVLSAHQKCIAVLDRATSLLSYAAAAVVSGYQDPSDWASVYSMSLLVPALSEVPSAAKRINDLQVLTITKIITTLLQSEAQLLGFESRFLEDKLYFRFLDT